MEDCEVVMFVEGTCTLICSASNCLREPLSNIQAIHSASIVDFLPTTILTSCMISHRLSLHPVSISSSTSHSRSPS